MVLVPERLYIYIYIYIYVCVARARACVCVCVCFEKCLNILLILSSLCTKVGMLDSNLKRNYLKLSPGNFQPSLIIFERKYKKRF